MSNIVSAGAIRLRDVTVAYNGHPALHHLSGSFALGSMTAIAGPNGAGKSTLIRAMMGQLPLAGGEIDRGGLSPRDFGYLPQAAEIDRSFPLSVADTVLLGAWREMGAFRGASRRIAEKARGRSAPFRPGSSSASCSRGSCCRMRACCFWTSLSPP